MSDDRLLPNTPVITNFESTEIGGSRYVIFKTTIEELVYKENNSPVIDAQIRALTAALTGLNKRKQQ